MPATIIPPSLEALWESFGVTGLVVAFFWLIFREVRQLLFDPRIGKDGSPRGWLPKFYATEQENQKRIREYQAETLELGRRQEEGYRSALVQLAERDKAFQQAIAGLAAVTREQRQLLRDMVDAVRQMPKAEAFLMTIRLMEVFVQMADAMLQSKDVDLADKTRMITEAKTVLEGLREILSEKAT
jgi:hypothetical protein